MKIYAPAMLSQLAGHHVVPKQQAVGKLYGQCVCCAHLYAVTDQVIASAHIIRMHATADITNMKILGKGGVDIDSALPFVGETLRELRKQTEGKS